MIIVFGFLRSLYGHKVVWGKYASIKFSVLVESHFLWYRNRCSFKPPMRKNTYTTSYSRICIYVFLSRREKEMQPFHDRLGSRL